MIWLELGVIALIVICVAMKFYNIGYKECIDDYNEVYDFKDEEVEREGE